MYAIRSYYVLLEADHNDPRAFSDEQAYGRLEAFVEVVAREASEAKITRAIMSPRQLQEIMVDFWFNHFNVDANKGLTHLWAGSFEREAIRPHAMGRFLDLLAAASMHPAMLIFLDNWRNRAGRGDEGLPVV